MTRTNENFVADANDGQPDTDSPESPGSYSPVKRYGLLMIAGWTLLVGLFAWQAWSRHDEQILDRARVEARAHFNKDRALRSWATSHGGVYVPSDERTPSSPHMAHVADRDIETPSGKRLTLMNPAYMLRQIMDEYAESYGVKGRITSLKPLRPQNAPDAWERKALRSFERGEDEAFEFSDVGGEPHLRLMRSLVATKGCIKCHGHQGYQEGDVRGGVGVSIPMEPIAAASRAEMIDHLVILSSVWLLGIAGIVFVCRKLAANARERETARLEREQLIEKLEAQNKELKSFSYTVSHDLKSPLITIKGFAGILKEDMDLGDTDAAKSDIARISAAADKMASLLDDLLELSRIGRRINPRKLVSLEDVAREAIELSEGKLTENGVEVSLSPDLPSVYADADRLVGVMQNLIDNAVKYMGDQPHPQVEISAHSEDNQTVCSVRDNGMGIAQDQCERIFGLFEQLDQTAEGTGVGLTAVRRIVEVHGGRVWVESKGDGQGATFNFTLPQRTGDGT